MILKYIFDIFMKVLVVINNKALMIRYYRVRPVYTFPYDHVELVTYT